MRKMTYRKVLVLVVTALMVLSIAACGGSTTPTPASTTTAPATSAASVSTPADPMAKYDQPVTVTWAVMTAAASKLLDGDTWDNNRWSKLIKDKLNIDLKVAFSADSSTDAYQNKLNAVISSGDLPDIFKSLDNNTFVQLQQNGQLADLTNAWNTYATADVKAYQTRFADAFKGASVDGKLYAIPRMNDNFHEAPFLWIRDDWLKNTNSTYPKTIEQMVDLARKFATGDPDKNGKNGDTVGLGLNKLLIRQQHADILGLVSAFGVPGFDEMVFYRDANGKMSFPWIDPNMKPALTLLNSMYKEGLINKDFTAKEESDLVEDWTNDKIGMAYGPSWGTWYPYNNVYKKDGVIVHPYPIPTEQGYNYKIGIESNTTGQMTMVSSNCKNPEAAIKILDLYEQTVNHETNAEYMKYWSDEQYRLCPVYVDIPNEVYEKDILDALNANSPDKLPTFAKNFYNYVVGFQDGSMAKDDNAYGTWGQMSKEGSLQWVLNKYEPEGAMVQSVLGIARPDIWVQDQSVLDTMTITAFTDIITGNKPVSYFDTYVQQWLKAGGQQTLDQMDKLYPAK